jgi:hypothetical protein
MKAQEDAVGAENDAHILAWAKRAECVIVAWGTHGCFQGRDLVVTRLLAEAGVRPFAWGINANGTPKHPLYLPKTSPLLPYVHSSAIPVENR